MRVMRWLSGGVLGAVLLLGLPALAEAQNGPFTLDAVECTPAFNVTNQGSVAVQINGAGTWTAELSGSIDGVIYTAVTLTDTSDTTPAAVASVTAAGQWTASVGGIRNVKVCLTAHTSGTPAVWLGSSASGGSAGSGGGSAPTEYTEDAVAPANPTAPALSLVRTDAPGALTSLDGDILTLRGTNFGAAFVQVLDSSGNFINTFGGAGGTSSNFGSAIPTAGTAVGFSDGTNMRAGLAIDLDTGAGTIFGQAVNLVFRGSGAVVEAGTASNPFTVNLGTAAVTNAGTFAVQATGTVTANAGTNLNTSALLTTAAHDAVFGTAGTADAQVQTIQGIASMTPVQVQSNSLTLPPGYTEDVVAAADPVGPVTMLVSDTTLASQVTAEGDNIAQRATVYGAAYVTLAASDGSIPTIAQDATHDSAASTTGPQIMGECDDTATDAVDEGDAAKLRVNCTTREVMVQQNKSANGILNVACDNSVIISTASSGSTQIVALSGSTVIYVCGYVLTAEGTVDVKLVNGTGTNCVTGPDDETPTWALTADRPVASYPRGALRTAAADALCVNLGGAVQVNGEVHYAQF